MTPVVVLEAVHDYNLLKVDAAGTKHPLKTIQAKKRGNRDSHLSYDGINNKTVTKQ